MQSTQPFFACPDKGVNSGLPDADWEKLTQLFQAAVALEPQERSAFVDRNTVGDEELRRRLRGMLEHDSTAADRIACVIGELAGSAPLPNVWLGRRFGPYRAVREIGRGGMGLVLEAVRDDSEFEKTVAIKVAPWGHDPAGFVQRFRNERQILAALEHPHIAHFLDGGTEDGTPFLVMEYVNGVRITEFARGLDVRSRVRLFQQVCSAVQYAHENLVVHRDLKPDNILVTTNGQVKLLDFGVAKLLGNVDSHLTASGAKLWTPDYASPEQIRGRAVTVRADVYSLGLILYEMLTGERAQVADLRSPLALDASICDSEPTRPSARLSEKGDATLARQLSGDLDVIVGKALRKEPEQRYGSAAEFSEDLQRYLEGRPVHARSRRWDYRTRRFVARHRIAVAAGVLAIAMAAAGTVAIAREARRAERRFAQVRGLANAFVFEVHDR
ncbi:MAG TPA: serine/threonine-protein kinase, partial [Bryobacteraceae bacterium]|nr:serine/threonine-protein kinase [Bryobacteraceae bacterium]